MCLFEIVCLLVYFVVRDCGCWWRWWSFYFFSSIIDHSNNVVQYRVHTKWIWPIANGFAMLKLVRLSFHKYDEHDIIGLWIYSMHFIERHLLLQLRIICILTHASQLMGIPLMAHTHKRWLHSNSNRHFFAFWISFISAQFLCSYYIMSHWPEILRFHLHISVLFNRWDRFKMKKTKKKQHQQRKEINQIEGYSFMTNKQQSPIHPISSCLYYWTYC